MTVVINGTSGITDVNGTAAAPAITGTDTDTGVFFGTNTVSLSTNGTERLQIDSSGNAGLGVTPSAWISAFKVVQVNSGALVSSSSSYSTRLMSNLYTNSGGNDVYQNAGYGLYYLQSISNGQHQWYNAPSGSAGATATMTQAMTLDASGRLMLNQTSPSSLRPGPLNIKSQESAATAITITGRSDGYGDIYFVSNDGATQYGAVEGGTTGVSLSGTGATNVMFGTNGSERARIDSSGNLLYSCTVVPTAGGQNGIALRPNGVEIANTPRLDIVGAASTVSNTIMQIYSQGASAYRFYIQWNGQIYATQTTILGISDERLKENIVDLDAGLDKIMALKPRKFDWKEGKGKDIKGDRGFIAQEFEQVFPDLVENYKGEAPEGEEPYKAVKQELIPVLVKAIQEQQAIIEQLQADVAALKGQA